MRVSREYNLEYKQNIIDKICYRGYRNMTDGVTWKQLQVSN